MAMRIICTSRPVSWGVLAVVCMLLPVAAAGDDADDIAREILRETPNRAEAAKKILDAARAQETSLVIQSRLCERAYTEAMASPGGYATAIAALGMLERVAPTRIDSWRAKRLEVHRLTYFRGPKEDKPANARAYVTHLLAEAAACGKRSAWRDAAKYNRQAYYVARAMEMPQKKALYEATRAADRRVMTQVRVKALTTAIEKTPTDARLRRQLVMIYLVDEDMPDMAAKYVSADIDAELRAKISLAAKDASELADEDFHALGR